MELGLNNLVDGSRIVQIDADSMPSAPHAARQGNHLLVNCHYSVAISGNTPRSALYEVARADVLEMIRRLITHPAIRSFLSVNVRVIGHFPYPRMTRPAIRRIYAVSIDAEDLRRSVDPITPDLLPAIKAVESSELDDVAELLHEAAT